MKYLPYTLIFIIALVFSSCEKIMPDLPRDNPNDYYFDGDEAVKNYDIKYFQSEITCKIPKGSNNYSEEKTIKAGDRIFMTIKLKNECNFDLNGIRATITSQNQLATVEVLSTGYYLKFSEGSTDDYIGVGKTGYGVITNGQYYHSAPNSNFYALEFVVSENAEIGDVLSFNINITDDYNHQWTENFSVTVNEAIPNLTFYSCNVACKYSLGSSNYSDDNTIKAGDRIFLNIKMKNEGTSSIYGIKANITSASNLITIEPLTTGYYLKFTQSSTQSYINAGSIGWGEITNGQYYDFAPNYNSYSVEFKVSETANIGDIIEFTIEASDNLGNEWNNNFSITVQ